MTHPSCKGISKLNDWKISGFVQSTYEVIPAPIVMAARLKTAIAIHLCVLEGIDPQLI